MLEETSPGTRDSSRSMACQPLAIETIQFSYFDDPNQFSPGAAVAAYAQHQARVACTGGELLHFCGMTS